MAVFEKKILRKVYLDDTEALLCVFENTQNIQGHTEYIIRVQRGPLPEKSWHIYKRYNDFVTLHNSILVPGLALQFPPKKLLGNMDREFIADRLVALQNYLNLVLANPIIAMALPVRKFLDPGNYSTPFQEVALQHVSMALRSEANFEVVKPLPDIGWRIRKHYFLIKCSNSPREEKILSWVENGPDKYLEHRDLQGVLKSLANLQHWLIEPLEFLSCNEVGGFVVRGLKADGSLRDHICAAKPKMQFMKKYAYPKEYKAIPTNDIALYGYQILEQLKFLQEKGLPFGHLHTGNVVVHNRHARLLDVENGVLGLPSFYRPYFVQHRAIQSLESVDVYCFGHVLYEMAFGQPLHDAVCDIYPPSCPPLLESVLELILSSAACKDGLPSLSQLMSHHFFSSVSHTVSQQSQIERPQFKLSNHQREALKVARHKIEARLKEEQRSLRRQKRLVKAQEMLSCSGDERPRKVRQPKQLSEQTQLSVNGKSPERSESPNSTSTATSAGTVTPPTIAVSNGAPPPPPPGLFEPPPAQVSTPPERSALLGSICNFNKTALRQTSVTP